ncbi:hypothetical protein ACS0TY_023756 [Phlomoides rotata]
MGVPYVNLIRKGPQKGSPHVLSLFLIVAECLSILMDKATWLGHFAASEIGRDRVRVSYLQLAKDTILMCAASLENTLVMRRIHRNMELLLGLKVNFDK